MLLLVHLDSGCAASVLVVQAKGVDVVVQLAALNALHSLLSLWDLDVSQCIAPALGWLLPALYSMFDDVTEMDSRQQVGLCSCRIHTEMLIVCLCLFCTCCAVLVLCVETSLILLNPCCTVLCSCCPHAVLILLLSRWM